MINLSIPSDDLQLKPRITVVGVGGAGGNAVNNMIKASLEGVEFLVANTDAQSLNGCLCERRLQLGVGITQGLGAGSRPDVGRAAAEEAMEEIVHYLEGSHMVFITAGMGGGTGTGAAPVIARAARDQGILTVGVVTKPFHFEGAHRMQIAEKGLQELQQYVDTLIVIPNQNLFRIANEKTTFADAFKMADDVLHSGVRGVTDLMVMPGLINLDFADIRTVMAEMGKAMMGTGEAAGDKRAVHAAEAAVSNPLLDEVSMKGARGVLINITGGLDLTLYEVDEAANHIRDQVDADANIIFGAIFDEAMEGTVRVSVVATGIDVEEDQLPRSSGLSLVSSQSGIRRVEEAPAMPAASIPATAAAPQARPMAYSSGNTAFAVRRDAEPQEAPVARVAETPTVQAAEPAPAPAPTPAPVTTHVAPEPQPAAAPTPEPAGPPRAQFREGMFISPKPVEPPRQAGRLGPAQPRQADPYAEADLSNADRATAGRRRSSSLFQRMVGLVGGEEATAHPAPAASVEEPAAAVPQAAPETPAAPPVEPPAAPPRAEAQPQPAQPRLDIRHRTPLPRHEDDALEIPAFLRRQAN